MLNELKLLLIPIALFSLLIISRWNATARELQQQIPNDRPSITNFDEQH